ncbi:hypothetical protein GHT06_009466 [Daphnia sinensis]|uniref:Uncharacterized protein n=1 Tax=Daphnia sinensis TaxID=1820382 RepID=A0AAD5L5L6_9CRUS|nr:hypothetical protein GHT06_009466 [Daphnia sinensis]
MVAVCTARDSKRNRRQKKQLGSTLSEKKGRNKKQTTITVIGAAGSNRSQPEEERGRPAQLKKQPGRNQHQPRDRFWFSESLGGISKSVASCVLSSSSKLARLSSAGPSQICRTSVFLGLVSFGCR